MNIKFVKLRDKNFFQFFVELRAQKLSRNTAQRKPLMSFL